MDGLVLITNVKTIQNIPQINPGWYALNAGTATCAHINSMTYVTADQYSTYTLTGFSCNEQSKMEVIFYK